MTTARLRPILEDVARRHAARRRRRPLSVLRAETVPDPKRRERFIEALSGPELSVIAECKRTSPSAGRLTPPETDQDPSLRTAARAAALVSRARAYAEGGAAALSILTEQDHFDGHPTDLAAVAEIGLPRLRKDFLLDEGMLLESLAFGADAVLLLAVVLDDAQLTDLVALARQFGLASLVEVHAAAELDRAVAVEPDLIGVNARDLRSFAVDLGTVEHLLPRVPAGILCVAESGLRTRADVTRVRAAGADAVLVGEALMRARDPASTLRELRGVLR